MSLGSAERTPSISPAEAKGYTVTAVPATQFGKYTLIGKLGHGGMAEVNLAVASGKGNFRKLVVIKRMHAHLESEHGFVDMFLDEARLAAQLDHPHCVQTLEVGEAHGQHFLAMEYLDGQGLERLLRITGQRGETLPPTLVARMVADALDGLGYAHELTAYDGTPLRVVHRDVSPQNLFVTYNGVVKLLDFGIAKAASNVTQTRTGVVKGKYAYIAPEQALATPVDARADVWAMGVVMWEMLTARRLFKADNEIATLQQTLTAPIYPPSKVAPGIPPELDRIVLRALTRDHTQRYQTAALFKDDLERYLSSAPDRVDRRDIAKLMQERFGEAVKLHRAKIAECLKAVTAGESVQRLIEGAAISASSEMAGLPSLTPAPSPTDPYLTPSGISMSASAIARQQQAVDQAMYPPQNYGAQSSGGYVMPPPTPMPMPMPSTSQFAAAPPKQREGRSFALGLVVLSAAVLTLVVWLVVWPRMSQTGDALPGGVGVVVVSGASPPTTAVEAPPTTALAIAPPPTTTTHHTTHRRADGAHPPDPAHSETPIAAPMQPTPSGGNGFVSLITSPWTHVTEGGHDLGDTPLVRIPLSAGHHSLRLVNTEAGISEMYEVDIVAGETTSRRLGLH